MSLTPLTELEAVNSILRAVGEQPVSAIPTSGLSEATLASQALNEVNLDIQGEGLHCNTNSKYRLVPDENGYLILPSGTLKIDAYYNTDDVTQRGTKLYDRTNNTYTFECSHLEVDIVIALEFEELPQHAKRYITAVAARQFQQELLGDSALDRTLKDKETSAKIAFFQVENDLDDRGFLDGNMSDVTNSRRSTWV